jgi:uncharacterized lipoprotein YddW (UPF0748 family)
MKINRRISIALLVTLGLIISLIFPNFSYSQTPTRKEIRGVWITNIDSDILFTRDRLRKAIRDLRQHNFNTIYPVVWNWGYTLYPSQVAQKTFGSSFMPKKSAGLLLRKQLTPQEGLEGRDALQEAVREGHKRGMAVIPWFEFGLMAPASIDPAGSDLAKLHPDWLTRKQNGVNIWREGKDPRVWLNPFRPEVQKFITDLVLEVVKKYNIDGVQFDDHFGLEYEFGYDQFTVDLYKQEHAGKAPPNNPKDEEWVNWRADKITAFMGELFKAVKAVKPKVIISVSPNPQGFAKSFFLQDWSKWERKGYIEELLVQIYRDNFQTFQQEISKPEVKLASQRIPVGIGILAGLKPKAIPMQQIQQQVAVVRDRGLAGVSFFFYETLWNLTKEPTPNRKQGFKQLFPVPANRPTISIDSVNS